MPVGWVNEAHGEAHKNQDGDDLEEHHEIVGAGGFLDPADQNYRQQHDDDEGRPVEAKMPAWAVQGVALKILQASGEIGGRNPLGIRMQAEPIQQADHVCGKAHADGHIADGVLQN
jgi:hypothetical protein